MVMKLGLPGGMTDKALLQLLLEKGNLTDMQMADTVTAAARVEAGGFLARQERDRLMSIAMAQKLTERTQIKKRSDSSVTANPGDPYSTRTTPGTIVGESLLSKYTKRDSRGALLISPPGRPRRPPSVPPPAQEYVAAERKTG